MKFDGPLLDERWRLGPRMGSGAQANTYVARDEKNPNTEPVIVKQLRLSGNKDAWKKFDLFEREIATLKSLRHAGIPRFITSFESAPGVFNLVMEKKPGATLRAISTRARFTDLELRDILARVLEILDYLHRLAPPVIHRDIKPANLVRAANGAIALVDFGGVRAALRPDGGSTVVGTFGYMAPEQLHGEATPATDIYSLGATIVALAAGAEPETIPRKGLAMDLGTVLAGSDPALVAVLEKMTMPDPSTRPQSARAVLDLLAKAGAYNGRRPASARTASLERRGDASLRDPHGFGDATDLLTDVPAPIAWPLRLMLLLFSLAGYLGLTAIRAIFIPLVFTVINAVTAKRHTKELSDTREGVEDILDEGRDGFRSLQRRALSHRRRRQLPPPR